ncbi:hypothetical protein EDB83DRAFT_636043 [Lactarius deliciosus]|nr:hypothetical protein EDB83DRAFT_636043 [Lactarius deliciosus]
MYPTKLRWEWEDHGQMSAWMSGCIPDRGPGLARSCMSSGRCTVPGAGRLIYSQRTTMLGLSFRTFFRLPTLSRDARLSRGLSVSSSTSMFRTAHVRCYAASTLAKKPPSSDQPRDPNHARDLPTSSANEREVFIQWDGTTRSKFHHIWLRDHCRCPRCFHSVTKQRLINTFEIPPGLEPVSTRSTADGLQVVCESACFH